MEPLSLIDLIEQALLESRDPSRYASSRELSLVATKLEEALLWERRRREISQT